MSNYSSNELCDIMFAVFPAPVGCQCVSMRFLRVGVGAYHCLISESAGTRAVPSGPLKPFGLNRTSRRSVLACLSPSDS